MVRRLAPFGTVWHAACCAVLLLACTGVSTRTAPDADDPSTPASKCLYGTLPGTFSAERPPGQRWQLLSRDCTLNNYVQGYELNADSALSSIVFLSDSMDFTMLLGFCRYLNGTSTTSRKHHTYNLCTLPNNETLPFGQVYLPTLTPQTDIQLPSNYQQGRGRTAILEGYQAKMQYARGNWSRDHPGQEPTLVVMGGGLWDIFRWLLSPNLPQSEMQVRITKVLDTEMLQWWIGCVRDAIRHAKSLFPSSHFVWRSFAMPAYSIESGRTLNVHLGMKSFVVQMKAAGWQAAMDEGLELVDVAALVEEFPSADRYLQDHHHPAPFVSIEVLNILLNIAARVRGQIGSDPISDLT